MKNANTKSRASSVSKSRVSSVSKLRARLLKSWAAVSVLAASLLFIGLLTGCTQNQPSAVDQTSAVDPADLFRTDGHGKITGYKCAKEELPAHLVIPAKIGDEEIKEIGAWVFDGCTGLRNVTLPASLTQIDEKAFRGCTGLTSISLPANLTEIGEFAFYDCTGLTSLDLSACTSITKIGGDAFFGCRGLTSITLPANLTKIERGAFSGCTGLTSVDLPASLTTIGEFAFAGCTGLTSVHLPANLTTIGEAAFAGCTGLTSLTIDSANAKYKTEGNILYNKAGTTLIFAAGGLTSANIPDTVTTIGVGAFASCTGLTSIRLPANLAQIGRGAFYGCEGLTSAVFVDKNGWAVYNDWEYKNKLADIQQNDLADTSKAAKYLRESTYNGGYSDKYWKKN